MTAFVRRLVAAAFACVVFLAIAVQPAGARAAGFDQNPVLFVHGIEGSGSQFESQKLRFTSNGYPEAWIDEVDYDSTRAAGDKSEVDAQIDEKIAALRKKTGREKVDVVAHSLGTIVMEDYITSSDERKASIGKYVNVDGQADNPGVPTLAVWAGRGEPGRSMDGATNVTIPNQTHVQTCTSKESFVEYYKFLTGSPPAHGIVPQTGAIELAGRALNFPQNNGLSGADVQLWEVDAAGKRIGDRPVTSKVVDDTGDFGPFKAVADKRYEFALVRDGFPTHHLYYEPFVRSDYAIRLLESDAISQYAGNRPGSGGLVLIRYKELWGDQAGQSDVLKLNGQNICTPELCPIDHQVNAYFAFDVNRNGQTDLTPDPVLSNLPFIQAADVFFPGASPPKGTNTLELTSRGVGPARVVKVPNWEATNDSVTVQFDDFESVDAAPAAGPPKAKECTRARAAVKKARRGVKKAQRAYRQHHTAKRRRALKKAKKKLARAKARQKTACR